EIDQTTLAPGESTTGTWTYKVTQADMDNGEIHNLAITEGTPPNYDPEDPEREKPRDEDDEKVTGNQDPALELTKKADKKEVVEAGEEITKTFTVTNIGNVTLTDVAVDDPMLEEIGI